MRKEGQEVNQLGSIKTYLDLLGWSAACWADRQLARHIPFRRRSQQGMLKAKQDASTWGFPPHPICCAAEAKI
jgi:hypothetical protein